MGKISLSSTKGPILSMDSRKTITINQSMSRFWAFSRSAAYTTCVVGGLVLASQASAQTDPVVAPIPKAAPIASTALSTTVAPMRYSFTTDKVKPPVVKVEPGEVFDATLGYGFVSVPDGNEQAFGVQLIPGDYKVTVQLGDPKAPSRTTLWSEDRRLMAAPVVLKKGEKKTVSFIVNVRNAFLSPAEQDAVKSPKVGLRGDESIGRTWDDLLTVSVSGEAPALRTLDIVPVKVRRVLLAGDSTVTDQAGADYASWGQMLPRYLDPEISVANHARSGETMKSFLTSLRWDKLMAETRPGDVVLIQFGHNDEKKQWPRTYSAADQAYPAYLAAFVADVRQRGALPVLVTPVARRAFKDGKIENTHAGYDQAVRDTAARLKVPLIDLTAKTTQLYEALGPDVSPLAFGDGGKDKTHHNAYGAGVIACYVATSLSGFTELGLKTAPGFVPCDPARPVAPAAYEIQPKDWPLMRLATVKTQGAEVAPVK
jgi:lysophospholipase L1-like esterase